MKESTQPQVEQTWQWPAPSVVEMNVCEIAHVILKTGQLYRFTVAEGCAACAAYVGKES